MKPPGHALVLISIGGVLWGITKSPYSFFAAAVAGVMIDVDHLVEYYRWFVREDNSRVWFFLHSYELLVPAFLASFLSGWDPVVTGVSAAFMGHLITDQIVNPVAPLAYFFTFRAMKGFRRAEIVNAEWNDIRHDFLRLPITRRVLSRFNPRIKGRR